MGKSSSKDKKEGLIDYAVRVSPLPIGSAKKPKPKK